MSTPTIDILLADGSALFREGLCELFRRYADMRVVGEAARGGETLHLVETLQPHVVLLDSEIPGATVRGIDVCRACRSSAPGTRILVLGRSRNLTRILNALRSGATGYVLRDVSFQQLSACIREACTGGDCGLPILADCNYAAVEDDTEVADLSMRERQVLGLVAQGQGNKEIGRALDISENTVRNHISKIFEKLRVHDRTEAAIRGLRRGLI